MTQKNGTHRTKRADMPLHVTYQNVKDSVAGDQRNCTFGQCAVSRENGMDFIVDLDPLDPQIWAEWITREDGKNAQHRADVRMLHRNGSKTIPEALALVAATDIHKRKLLKKFPETGMDFVLTNHTVKRNSRVGNTSRSLRPGETEEERITRLESERERRNELKRLRDAGAEPAPKKRQRRIRARFG